MFKFNEPKDLRDKSAAFGNPYFHYLGKNDGFEELKAMIDITPIARRQVALQSLVVLDFIFQVAFHEGHPRNTITQESYSRFLEKLNTLRLLKVFTWINHPMFKRVPNYKIMEEKYNWYIENARVGVCMTMGKDMTFFPMDKEKIHYEQLYNY